MRGSELTLLLFFGFVGTSCSTPANVTAASARLMERSFFNGHLRLLVPQGLIEANRDPPQTEWSIQGDCSIVLQLPERDILLRVVRDHFHPEVISATCIAQETTLALQIADAWPRSFPTAQVLQHQWVARGHWSYFVSDLRSDPSGHGSRNMMTVTVVGEEILFVEFSCRIEDEDSWAPIGHRILDSVVASN
jgi:hypothetical protein